MTEQITSADWQTKVVNAQEPVLVDFFATWCGSCKTMAPIIDEIAEQQAGSVSVYKIDIDNNIDIAQQYKVLSIPTFIVFKAGQPTNRALGVQSKEAILALLD